MIDIKPLYSQGAWKLEDEGDGIARLVFDLPGEKVNKLTSGALEDLEKILKALAQEQALRALIVWGGKESSGTFIAGADIHEIRAVTEPAEAFEKARRGQEILGLFSSLPAVTVAAIHGMCLGGGTELALACDLRIASHSPKTRIGLPEVQLGILPGFGGTQRLPRLVGIASSLPVILQGKRLDVHQAMRIGLVDAVVYPDLLRREAKALAQRALLQGGKKFVPRERRAPSLFQRLLENIPGGRSIIRRQARKEIEKASGHFYPAPYRALDAVIEGCGKTLKKGLELEASLVKDLVVSPIAKNLIDLFVTAEEARRGKKHLGRGGPDRSREASGLVRSGPSLTRGRVGLLGSGVMGGSIAALLAQNGYRVRMKDINAQALQAGWAKVRETYAALEKKRRMTRREAANRMACITVTTDYSGFEGASVVLEAVVEDLEVKKKVLREVEERIPDSALLASNTSALPVSELQMAVRRPERVVGLHFFNPVNRMPLVEVVRGKLTSEEALQRAETLARDLGKIPIRVEDSPGFLVNRLLAPYLNEAARLFEEGFSPLSIDQALKEFGMPMGPFELLDEVGLDVAAKVAERLYQALGERAKPPKVLEKLLQEGKLLGKKSGRGFYLHSEKSQRKKAPNPDLLRFGGGGGSFKPDPEAAGTWVKRTVYPMINEAARALEEKIVEGPPVLDLAMVMGTGFAPFRGGPLRYADALGPREVASFLDQAGAPHLRPCELLIHLAKEGSKFYDLEKAYAPSPS